MSLERLDLGSPSAAAVIGVAFLRSAYGFRDAGFPIQERYWQRMARRLLRVAVRSAARGAS